MEESGSFNQDTVEQLRREEYRRRGRQLAGNGRPPPHRKCPRCDSSNTKFCYYNNYSLSQPRHFCKACRRYWTHGGALRNVPVGGSCRKANRSQRSSSSTALRSSSLAIPSPNLTALIPSGESAMRALANPFYNVPGGFFSPVAAAQSVPIMADQGGGGGANFTLLPGINLPSFTRSPVQNELSTNLNNGPPPAVSSWSTQQSSFATRDDATIASNSSALWIGGATTICDNDDHSGLRFNNSL